MLNAKIVKQSLSFSLLTVLYIALVATVMNNAAKIFGEHEKGVIGPIVFLLILVISVAAMGVLIFGKPIMLYLDGKKRDAVVMLICTIGILMLFTGLLLTVGALIV